MRSAILTNSAVGASNGVLNPQASNASATLSSSTQAAAQTSQHAIATSSKVLASERSVALEKRAEESFDNQKYDRDHEDAQIEKRREEGGPGTGRLIAVA